MYIYRFNGSTLQVRGFNHLDREWSIIGGTGEFTMARGVAKYTLENTNVPDSRLYKVAVHAYYSSMDSTTVSSILSSRKDTYTYILLIISSYTIQRSISEMLHASHGIVVWSCYILIYILVHSHHYPFSTFDILHISCMCV